MINTDEFKTKTTNRCWSLVMVRNQLPGQAVNSSNCPDDPFGQFRDGFSFQSSVENVSRRKRNKEDKVVPVVVIAVIKSESLPTSLFPSGTGDFHSMVTGHRCPIGRGTLIKLSSAPPFCQKRSIFQPRSPNFPSIDHFSYSLFALFSRTIDEGKKVNYCCSVVNDRLVTLSLSLFSCTRHSFRRRVA